MPETVLIVDNEPNHLRIAEYAISQKLGYYVVTASSGEEAVRWILSGRQPQPDLLLLDLAIPRVGGLQVLHQIKTSRPQLPVIALVPYGDDENIAQAAQMGVDDALSKPVTLERLRFSLRNVLAIRRLKRFVVHLEGQVAGGNGFSKDERETSLLHNSSLPNHLPELFDREGRIKKLRFIEEEIIRFVLHHCGGCMTRTARQLGIGRSTLYRRVNDLAIDGYISRANQATRPMMVASSAERS